MISRVAFVFLGVVCAVGFGALVGGFSNADPNEEGARNALNFAIAQHNAATNDMFLRVGKEVIDSKKQIVSGVKYVFTVKMVKTNCRKDAHDECAMPADAQPYQCTFTVWSRPWIQDIRLIGGTNC
ncbi:cystatin C (amyloid angiopathy and cerebral hemorrhage) [Syngnathus scovelli]|uniref:cystatin C (amyloid angiopathy and cerebral hemorrhage) n=1 Tax=Syngnathus scovelli TaxID=161590 RepID=UPI00210F8F29|nr:cystatin C (amyloid angiopathy and cerebral hemorrhage) [Syngnathus scovelli]